MKKKNKPYFETFNNKSIKSIEEDFQKLETKIQGLNEPRINTDKIKKQKSKLISFLMYLFLFIFISTATFKIMEFGDTFKKALQNLSNYNIQQREVNNIYYLAQEFKKEDGQIPTLEELEYKSPFTNQYSNKYADAWGNNLIYQPEKYPGIRVICSAGKDGIENTEDDICVNPKEKIREDRQKENNDSLLFFLLMAGATSGRR